MPWAMYNVLLSTMETCWQVNDVVAPQAKVPGYTSVGEYEDGGGEGSTTVSGRGGFEDSCGDGGNESKRDSGWVMLDMRGMAHRSRFDGLPRLSK